MTSKIITGNKRAEDILREYFQREANPIPPLNPTPPSVSVGNPPLQATSTADFYTFDRTAIHQATTPAYRTFLKDAGYADLDTCSGVSINKKILRYTQEVRDKGINGTDGAYVVNITPTNGKDLIERLGGKLLTTALMYQLFIPYIKDQAQAGNTEAQATLKEMTDTKAEWLEDLVVDQSKIKIGNREINVSLPLTEGQFDRSDLNELGYPTTVKNTGEFRYWYPRDNVRAAFRDRGVGLDLVLDGGPSGTYVVLGVRRAKFFL